VLLDASGAAAGAAAGEPLFLVKPNCVELEAMVGRPVAETPAERVAACRQLTGHVDNVLLSLGAEGAMLVNAKAAVAGRVPLDAAEVHNAVGCGDALMAGFLAGLLERLPRRDTLRRALAVATAAAVRNAGDLIDVARVDEFAETAEVGRVRL
jgi:fructose-1-phosphate kinase PfkB-like protein